jgi:polyisoprenoid-binding protein YceI
MRLLGTLGLFALAAGGFAVALSLAFAAPNAAQPKSTHAIALAPAAAANYAVDPTHSAILFRAKHMSISHAWGRFDKFSGQLKYDEKDPSACAVRIEVETASINTADAKRDAHLSNNDFFNAKQFPKLAFTSTKVSAGSAGKLKVDGELEMLGVKKPLSFEIAKVGEGEFPMDQSHRIGFDATFTIRRSEYGMKYGLPDMLGDEVLLTISLEAIRE